MYFYLSTEWKGTQSEDPMLFPKKDMKMMAVSSISKKPVLILAPPPTTQTTKLLHLFKHQVPHVYNKDEIIVFAKKKLEVNKVIHENHST